MQKITPEAHAEVIERCLEAYLRVGTIDLSLDQLGAETGATKRMLVHYFGNRQEVERRSIALFEERLKARFQTDRFVHADSLKQAVMLLWEELTAPEFRGSLNLIFAVFRRGVQSDEAWAFHEHLCGLWSDVLRSHTSDPEKADELVMALKSFAWAHHAGPIDAKCRGMLERLATS